MLVSSWLLVWVSNNNSYFQVKSHNQHYVAFLTNFAVNIFKSVFKIKKFTTLNNWKINHAFPPLLQLDSSSYPILS